MDKQAMSSVVAMICNRLCLDHMFLLAFQANPMAALIEVSESDTVKNEIIKNVQKIMRERLKADTTKKSEDRVEACTVSQPIYI